MKKCMDFCRWHDDTWHIKSLDFLQCYIGYIVGICGAGVQIQEFVPGKSLLGVYGETHLMPVKYLPKTIDTYTDSFNRIVFRFIYNNVSEYYFLTSTAVKTSHLRLGVPGTPSIDSVAITANMIGSLKQSICRTVCQSVLPNVYLIRAIFGKIHYEYPWCSWPALLHNNEQYEIIKWDYQDNIGLSVVLYIYNIEYELHISELPVKPFFGVQLDGTGHISDKAIAGFYLPEYPDTAFIVAESIFKNFSCQEDLNTIYKYSRCRLDEEIKKYALLLKKDLNKALTRAEYLQYCNHFYYRPGIDKIFGKRDYMHIRKYFLRPQESYSKLSLKTQCMRAIHDADTQLKQRFYYNGKQLMEHITQICS